jgi:arginyl-tRNA synthetase
MSPEQRQDFVVKYALKEKIQYIQNTLGNFGIHYDVWFNESSLHESGQVSDVIERLREKGYIYEEEGALWF